VPESLQKSLHSSERGARKGELAPRKPVEDVRHDAMKPVQDCASERGEATVFEAVPTKVPTFGAGRGHKEERREA